MHELSIIQEVVAAAERAAGEASAVRVKEVTLRVGALAGVVEDALEFSYGVATRNTLLAGSRLVVKHVPVVVYCARCRCEVELPGIQALRCPGCGALCADVRSGRELEVESLVIETDQ